MTHLIETKLEHGAKVADVGCGDGQSTIVMAQRYRKSRFFGFDANPESIESARKRAEAAGVSDRVNFAVASPPDVPGREYDLVRVYALENGASRGVEDVLAPGGACVRRTPIDWVAKMRQ